MTPDGSRGVPAPGARFLWADLVDDVEWRPGHPAEPGVPGIGGEPLDRLLTGLRAEGVAAVLGERARDAQERGEGVVDPADRVEVVAHAAACVRLNHHPGAVGREH